MCPNLTVTLGLSWLGQTGKAPSGYEYTVVETKISDSSAVWIIHKDWLKMRQVFCHIEGIHIFPIDHLARPEPATHPDKEKTALPAECDRNSIRHTAKA